MLLHYRVTIFFFFVLTPKKVACKVKHCLLGMAINHFRILQTSHYFPPYPLGVSSALKIFH